MAVISIIAVASITTAATWYGWAHTGAGQANLAGWIEAVSTAAAVTVATIAAVFAYYAYQIEEQREAARIDTLRRDQASRVAAWWGQQSRDIGPVGQRAWGSVQVHGTQFRNASEVPVSEVTVCGYIATELVGVLNLLIGPPGDQPDFFPWPTETLHFIDWLAREAKAQDELQLAVVELYFTDAQGIRWYRSPGGDLLEISNEAEPARQPTEADFERFRHQYTPLHEPPPD